MGFDENCTEPSLKSQFESLSKIYQVNILKEVKIIYVNSFDIFSNKKSCPQQY